MYVKTESTKCRYITPGKLYKLIDNRPQSKHGGSIMADNGIVISIFFPHSSHLEGEAWEVVSNESKIIKLARSWIKKLTSLVHRK